MLSENRLSDSNGPPALLSVNRVLIVFGGIHATLPLALVPLSLYANYNSYRNNFMRTIQTMLFLESDKSLLDLGQRLRALRVQRNETQAVFSARIGVAVPTLRDMEQGKPTVQIGAWVNAIWALGRLSDLDPLLAVRTNIFDRIAEQQQPQRKRPFVKRRSRKAAP